MPLLETQKLEVFYGDFQALFGLDFTIEEGETVAMIGANGAGKSTVLRSLAGLNHDLSELVKAAAFSYTESMLSHPRRSFAEIGISWGTAPRTVATISRIRQG